MALSHKAKKRWSLGILLVALPVYITVALNVLTFFWEEPNRPPILVELFVYLLVGILWILPFKKVFLGVGQQDPNAPQDVDR